MFFALFLGSQLSSDSKVDVEDASHLQLHGHRHRIENGHRNGGKFLKICLDGGMLDNSGIIHGTSSQN